MSVGISYMGTKRRLATAVSQVLESLPEGAMLDVFSGMCAVPEAVAPSRPVWTNDIQPFPAMVGRALVSSCRGPQRAEAVWAVLEKPFERNMEALERRFSSYLAREEQYHATHALEDVVAGNTDLPYVGNDEQLARERLGLAEEPHTFPYRLATITFAGAYFGCKQCMEIDSLRYSIDSALAADHIDAGQRDWLLIALGRAMSRINNSTGQFAQYLKPRLANVHRILKQRSRSASKEFLQAFGSLSPIGTEEWRSRNCSFQCDALSLLASLGPSGCRPAIVYADPPYSPAQYSRYYHVLDVITEYSYPAVSGVGRYPSNRYQTPFAHSGRVLSSLSELVERVRALDACLVLSYPKNGLFVRQGGNVLELLRKHYGNAFLVFADEQEHSTFGGPNATPKVSVVEQIFMAYV